MVKNDVYDKKLLDSLSRRVNFKQPEVTVFTVNPLLAGYCLRPSHKEEKKSSCSSKIKSYPHQIVKI